MRVRTIVQNVLDLILPDDPPGTGQSGELINTGSPDGETNNSESRTTYEVPPSYSNLPSIFPPSYSELFPSTSRTPSPTPASIPTQKWQSKSNSFSRPRPTGSRTSAALRAPPRFVRLPFEAKYYYRSMSILFRLPDKILELVIKGLDNPGIECLRRVSRRFNALCNKEILARPYTFQPRWKLSDRDGPFEWPRFRAFDGWHAWTHIAAGERAQFLQLITKDGYCEGCRMARDAPDWERRVERLRRYLYCHACKADHPACLFPWWQRQIPAVYRRCIAHEGYFRLCQHDEGIIRWSEISWIMKQSKHGEHEVDCSIRCEDDSHVVSCAETSWQRSGKRIWNACCAEWPMPELKVDGSRIQLRWSAHMPVQTNGAPLTEHDLRLGIQEIRGKGGRFLYPATTSEQDVPEMRCFDSNECDCVSFEGAKNLIPRPGPSPTAEGVCKTNFSRKLPQNIPDVRSLRTPCAPSSIRKQLRSHTLTLPWACESSSKMHTARWYSFGPAQVKVACWPCHSSDSCLVLDYTRVLTVGRDGAIDAQWYQALDPESYNLTEDKEGFEVYWCRQRQCRNYYGCGPGFSRILGGKEYHS